MKISFLVLTHNRPELFKRCINSLLNQIPVGLEIEILVNNDSHDIEEIFSNTIKYYYNQFSLGEIYKFLFSKAKGEFIYFLEDDDYLLSNFFTKIDLNYDLNYGNYAKVDTRPRKNYFEKDFQFGQILFKKNLITLDEFPCTDDLDNDYKLFKLLKIKTKNIYQTKKYFFRQTTDGGDNISFLNGV